MHATPQQQHPDPLSMAAPQQHHHKLVPTTAAACCHCGAPDTVVEWHERFKLLVCSPCFRRQEKLISKSNAKSVYLLSDSDLSRLGFIEKQNPRHTKFANMKQYLVSQVEAVAVAKHGSLEALEEEKQRRMQGKLEQRMHKRQAAEQEEERQRRLDAQLQATLDKYTAQAEAGGATSAEEGASTARRKRKKQLQQHEPGGVELEGVEVEEF